MAEPLLTFSSVSMEFRGFKALKDISFSIEEHSATALIGPNGAGKTTLLNCVCGTYRPSSGDILFRGESLLRHRPHHRLRLGISRTFQNVENLKSLSVLELVMLGSRDARGANFFESALSSPRALRAERRQQVLAREVMELVGIGSHADARLDTLPYAIRKTADLARALVCRPSLLLLDEPTAGTTERDKDGLHLTLRRLKGELYDTLVVVDHDIPFLKALCDFSVVLDFGEKIAEGSTTEVLSDTRVVEAYLGAALEDKEPQLIPPATEHPFTSI